MKEGKKETVSKNAEMKEEREKELCQCLLPVIISFIVFLAAYTNGCLEQIIPLCCVGLLLSLYGMGRFFIYKLKQ